MLEYDAPFTAVKPSLIARRKTGLAKNGTLCMVPGKMRVFAFHPICQPIMPSDLNNL
jgi:hypothetical protein